MQKFKELFNSNEMNQLNENIFSDMYSTFKASLSIKKEADKFLKSLGPVKKLDDERQKEFKSFYKTISKIIDDGIKDEVINKSYKINFVVGILEGFLKINPDKTGEDIKKLFDIPSDIYTSAYRKAVLD